MWLKPLAVLVAAGIATVSAISLANGDSGSGPSAGSGSRGLTISPSSGGPATAFSLSFTAPDSTGRSGNTSLAYDVAAAGPSGAGCLPTASAGAPPATKGGQVSVTLDPARLGGQWCPGTYTVKVTEIQRPVCLPGTMCPQYIRVVANVATGTFRVSG
jgi:hypothetical protein